MGLAHFFLYHEAFFACGNDTYLGSGRVRILGLCHDTCLSYCALVVQSKYIRRPC